MKININVKDLDENQKSKLRGIIHFFNGERNNIGIKITNKERVDPAGSMLYNEKIHKEIVDVIGEDNIKFE